MEDKWHKIIGTKWICDNCKEEHDGLPDIAFDRPCMFPKDIIKHGNSEVFDHGDTVLTEDFCIYENEHFFVRCILPIPLTGYKGDTFAFGVWTTLSKDNFNKYLETFDEGKQEFMGTCFGWLSNNIKLSDYPSSIPLKLNVYPQNNRARPKAEIQETEHPLYSDQRDGISFEKMIEILGMVNCLPAFLNEQEHCK